MIESPLRVLAVVGSLNRSSSTRAVIKHLVSQLQSLGCSTDLLDLLEEPLALFNPDYSHGAEGFSSLKARVEQADAYILGTPDYHGSISSAMKNFLDHFWHEFAGKLFATVVASHEKGLTVTDQLRTVARQCYAWCLPYGVSFNEAAELKDNVVVSDSLTRRLEMLAHDVSAYGSVLARQRRADLLGTAPGFMAKHRETIKN
jgi:NAD(P)H-dependent FMN reductase